MDQIKASAAKRTGGTQANPVAVLLNSCAATRVVVLAAAVVLACGGCSRPAVWDGNRLVDADAPASSEEGSRKLAPATGVLELARMESGSSTVPDSESMVHDAPLAEAPSIAADDDSAPVATASVSKVARINPKFVKVVAGTYSTCGIRQDGTLQCWGMACSAPSPGDRSTTCWGRTCADGDQCSTFGSDAASLPNYEVAAPPKGTFVNLNRESGSENWCALDAEGVIKCWGYVYASAPPAWPAGSKFVQVASSARKECGILLDGSLACLFGDVLDSEDKYTSISASPTQLCALREDGTVRCWGETLPPPATTFVELDVGGFHACGLRDDDTLACWGRGTTGSACNAGDLECGQALAPAGEFMGVATGFAHSCGLRPDGAIECWGAGTSDNDCDPTSPQGAHMQCGQAKPPSGHFIDVSAGPWHTCAVDTEGEIVCWGHGRARGACGGTSGSLATDCGQAAPPF